MNNTYIPLPNNVPPGSYAEKVLQHAQSLEGRQGAMRLAVTEDLWAALEATGTNQAELARRAGTSPQYIAKLFKGSTNFTLDSLVRLFYHVGYDVEFEAKPRTGVAANAVHFRPASMMPYAFAGKGIQPANLPASIEEQTDGQALTA